MKKIQSLLLASVLMLGGGMTTSCTDYQDEIDALDVRVTYLESLVKEINSELAALQIIADAMAQGDYITGLNETDNGYVVNFAKYGPMVITDGIDGQDGQDAEAPNISILQDPTDGQWYWTVNGEWIVVDGEKVRANGKDGQDGKDGQNGKDGKDGVDGKDGADGKDGQDGKDGKDAISPQVRINPETGIWEYSVDGGVEWYSTGTSAKGADGKDGKDGKDGADGKDGKDGKDGRQLIEEVNYTADSSGEWLIIKLKSGLTIKIPILKSETV